MPLYKKVFIENFSATTEFVKVTHKDGTVEVVCHECERQLTSMERGLILQNVKPPVGTKCAICSTTVQTIQPKTSGFGDPRNDKPRRQTYGQPGKYTGD